MTGGTLNARQEEAVDTIRASAKRLEGLISDMLDAQKLDMRKMRFTTAKVVAHDVVKTVMSNFRNAMIPKNIEFIDSTNNETKLTALIKCDKDRLIQVLSNLVANAIDFVPSQNGKVETGLFETESEVTFYVKDNGTGIPRSKQSQLFTKFYQVDTSVTRRHGGSGLGLAICKGIVESLGGRIWVESDEGKGSAFYFTMPKHEDHKSIRREQQAQ
jgi:signal transduction histidine kinase